MKQKELKYYICLFKIAGHETWRLQSGKDLLTIEKSLKTNLGKNVVTAKQFIEVDRLTGMVKPLLGLEQEEE